MISNHNDLKLHKETKFFMNISKSTDTTAETHNIEMEHQGSPENTMNEGDGTHHQNHSEGNSSIVENDTIKETKTVNNDEVDGVESEQMDLQATGDIDEKTPDHHARRPMNAFLIFCKRHRAIVREKYPNLENRSITKILGDWWANLEKDEKSCYTNLAKQYKDAFFNANPNFKWYKLPAPPLRTLPTRPLNMSDCEDTNSIIYSTSPLAEPVSYNIPSKIDTTQVNSVGMFKLADETQMGGLNSLMVQCNSNNNNVGEDEEIEEKPLDETTKRSNIQITEPFLNMKDHAAKMELNSMHNKIDGKRKLDAQCPMTNNKKQILSNYDILRGVELVQFDKKNDFRNRHLDGNAAFNMNDHSSHFDAMDMNSLNKKSSRACKGKRYKEFMTTGKINHTRQRTKVKSIGDPSSVNRGKYDYTSSNTIENDLNLIFNRNSDGGVDGNDAPGFQQADVTEINNGAKLFDASDFDLEDKIKALPSLSLDKYLSRKRETKKQKKMTGKNKRTQLTIHEAREQIKKSMVGSRKRKARKESITRRDVNSVRNDNNNTAINDSNPTVATSDLFILATLAEEEAKKSTNHINDDEHKHQTDGQQHPHNTEQNQPILELDVSFLS